MVQFLLLFILSVVMTVGVMAQRPRPRPSQRQRQRQRPRPRQPYYYNTTRELSTKRTSTSTQMNEQDGINVDSYQHEGSQVDDYDATMPSSQKQGEDVINQARYTLHARNLELRKMKITDQIIELDKMKGKLRHMSKMKL